MGSYLMLRAFWKAAFLLLLLGRPVPRSPKEAYGEVKG